MKAFFDKAKSILAIISGVALILYVIRLLKPAPSISDGPFPKAAEKAAAEKAVEVAKEDIEKLGEKVYSDEDIEKRFNK
jgi:hypothetical protein